LSIDEKFLIIDGNSIACRAAFAHNPKFGNDLSTSDGRLTGATFRFFTMLNTMLHKLKPTHVVVCWDIGRDTFRKKLDDNYKGNREKKNDELYEQFSDIKIILETIGINNVSVVGFEADDIIGTYSKLSKANKTYIVSGDKDTFQLVNKNTVVMFPRRGFNDVLEVTPEYIEEQYNINYKRFVDLKALTGDAGDNIKGIDGCAEKTASKLLNFYESALDVANNKNNIECKGINKRVKEGILNWAPDVDIILKLVTIRTDVPVYFSYDECKVDFDWDNAREIFDELEMNSFIKKLDGGELYHGR